MMFEVTGTFPPWPLNNHPCFQFFFGMFSKATQKTDMTWPFKEMQLSWDIHPSVTWMATLRVFFWGVPSPSRVFIGLQKRFQKAPGRFAKRYGCD